MTTQADSKSNAIRQAFEAAYTERMKKIGYGGIKRISVLSLRDRSDAYKDSGANEAWWAWQAAWTASRKQALTEAAEICDDAWKHTESTLQAGMAEFCTAKILEARDA